MDDSVIEVIAKTCHQVNKAFCEAHEDNSQLDWEKAPEWQRVSAIAGVREALNNPDITAEKLHQAWVDKKIYDGWKYGPVKDQALKTHPCIVEYDKLPHKERVKDHLFRAVVDSLRDLV